LKIDINLKGRFKDALKLPDPYPMEVKEESNVRDLLDLLCHKTGCPADTFFNRDMRLKPNVAVTKNGRFIIHLNWLDTSLSEGDTVTIFTLHCGG
jgi:sulfur carrier protein ThiS